MRRILVTGANKGIGLAIVQRILTEQADTHVLLGSRSAERGRAALNEIGEAQPDLRERVTLLDLDVADDASVSRAAEVVAAPLYGVVNNAGIGGNEHGLEAVLNVNVRGIHRVAEAFLPLLEPDGGRIVNVTSASGPTFVSKCSPEMQKFFLSPDTTWEALDRLMRECVAIAGDQRAFAERGLGEGDAYGLSKACANTYTQRLALEHPRLRINACTPGFIATDMTRRHFADSGKTPQELGMKSPAEGATAPLFLLFGDPPGNGRYYGSDAKRSPLDRYRAPGAPEHTGD
jgi:NAD(P)-dependent dehydrogenase (short-subunit alcohol dehydrogenase family)